jgi:signal transduction histidine kinase
MKTAMPLSRRLFLQSLIILLVGMGVAALLAYRTVEGLYLDTQRENLLAQAGLTAASLAGQPLTGSTGLFGGDPQPYSQTTNVMPGIHTRLLGEQGGVIYSLPVSAGDVTAPPAENNASISPQDLLARPEIASALQGQPASSVRAVASRRVLYAAAPVVGPDGTVSGLVYLAMPLPAAGLPPQLLLELAGAGLAAVLAALAAGTLLARRIVSPVEEIARASAAVSAGDLTQQVATGSGICEINSLGQAFNHMTASLRQSDQAKNAFVADVTHELRTPLTVIKGTIETLEDGALDDLSGRGPLLQAMQRETDRLIRLVNDLLVLTRADAGALNLDIQPLDLAALARARCAHLAPLADRCQVGLDVTGAEPAWAWGDADRLIQVLDNLLDNALRYSPPGSTITIALNSPEGEVECAVVDQGPGIAAEHLPLIFDRFYRTDASRNRQTGGAGLGLAIVRALVAAQGGRIWAESQVGQGTTLRFTLPACEDLELPRN